MKTNIPLLFLLVFCLNACKNETKTQNTAAATSIDTLLKLNEGAKWTANAETQIGFKKMQQLLSAFDSDNLNDYKKLGSDLSAQTSNIVSKCTMTGEAHDQLHSVLLPILEEVSKMSASQTVPQSKESKQKIEAFVEAYFAHFEL